MVLGQDKLVCVQWAYDGRGADDMDWTTGCIFSLRRKGWDGTPLWSTNYQHHDSW